MPTALFWIDPLDTLHPVRDTSLLLMQEAVQNGYSVYTFETRNLYVTDDVYVDATPVEVRISDSGADVLTGAPQIILLRSASLCFIRKDPPVDLDYIATLQLMAAVEDTSDTLFVNSPGSLLKANEKLYSLRLMKDIPKGFIGMNSSARDSWIADTQGPLVFKPLNEAGSRGVSLWQSGHGYAPTFPGHSITQTFLSEVAHGDRRVFMIDGQIAGAISRIPQSGEFRCALGLGADLDIPVLNEVESDICRRLGEFLVRDQILFAGLDLIAGQLIEVNVTSPTLMRQWNQLTGNKMEKELFHVIREKQAQSYNT